jgi:DNA-directed RNA polymerase subunit beta'
MIDFPRTREQRTADFEFIQVKLASPEEIRSWSFGEVVKPETINYRSFKPERDGLFCERIFGPVKDWECHCGKFKRIRFRGHVCDRCGVEVTLSKVRRERMGHIELAVPVAHIWFFKTLPSQLGYLLGMTLRDLEKVIYYAAYVVTNPGKQDVEFQDLLDEDEYYDLRVKAREEGDDEFRAEIGAEAARTLLKLLDTPDKKKIKDRNADGKGLDRLADWLRYEIANETSQHRKKKKLKRLKVVDALRTSGDTPDTRNRPEWMILDVIPVIPPDLRPARSARRRPLRDVGPERPVPARHQPEQPVQEADRHAGPGGHPPQREADAPGGRRRALRQRPPLQGDPGPRQAPAQVAQRHAQGQAGPLPAEPARQARGLLGPLGHRGRPGAQAAPVRPAEGDGRRALQAVHHPRAREARRSRDGEARQEDRGAADPKVYEVLEDIIKDHPVLLNRAPTLHRLGIQAFEPVLVEGKAIRIHPLVCAAFNADFDGDQMAVHLPLSFEAQLEARVLMLSSNNILLPSNGRPVAAPTQDMVIGAYYLTNPGLRLTDLERVANDNKVPKSQREKADAELDEDLRERAALRDLRRGRDGARPGEGDVPHPVWYWVGRVRRRGKAR